MREKRHSKGRNKKFFGVIVVPMVLVSGLTIVALYNYKSIKSAENNFIPSEITNAVQENGDGNENPVSQKDLSWVLDENNSCYTAEKQVNILNVDVDGENNTDAYIRVCMIPRWIRTVWETDTSQKTEIDVTNVAGYTEFGNLTDVKIDEKTNTYIMGDVIFKLADNWSENWIYNEKDGYFYYKNIVPPDGTTEMLLENVSISKDTYNRIDDDIFLRIDIISDSIQTEGGAPDARWAASGIAIDNSDVSRPLIKKE